MAKPQVQKKRSAGQLSQHWPPSKRARSMGEPRCSSNFPPEFWDNLSKVWLTARALRELDRRNGDKPPREPSVPVGAISTGLARFARLGGPDLSQLRRCHTPPTALQEMRSRSGSQSEWTRATRPTPITSRSKRSSAYDNGFEQHLVDNKIYPKGYDYPGNSIPRPRNIDDIHQALSAPRRSLSPSRFPLSAFEGFERANDRVISEGRVMSDIVPTIRGNSNIPSEGNLVFTNFDSMTHGATTNAVPDFYDGASPRDISTAIRRDLSRTVIPTNHADAPVAPNFFLEAKARKGGADVARRQACYDGAYGARAMHALQNFGRNKPTFDGNAYTYSSTYHAGEASLQLYAHHATAPATPGDLPEYHMTKLRTYAMADTHDSFVSGATAFRNARDLAQSHRDRFIQEANARAQARPGTSRGATERQQVYEDDRRPYAVPGSPSGYGYGPSASSSSHNDPDPYKRSRESVSPPSRGSKESKRGRR